MVCVVGGGALFEAVGGWPQGILRGSICASRQSQRTMQGWDCMDGKSLHLLQTAGGAGALLGQALLRALQVLDCVLGGRPLICLEFANMEMEVQAPVPWRPRVL